jgi:hypothetical protein
MKAYLGSGGIAPTILELGTRWRWVISFTPRPLYPQGRSPWYPLDRMLGGPQSRSGRGGEEKNSQPLPGIEPPIIHSVVSAIPLSYKVNSALPPCQIYIFTSWCLGTGVTVPLLSYFECIHIGNSRYCFSWTPFFPLSPSPFKFPQSFLSTRILKTLRILLKGVPDK